jgi:hypothetical protein
LCLAYNVIFRAPLCPVGSPSSSISSNRLQSQTPMHVCHIILLEWKNFNKSLHRSY